MKKLKISLAVFLFLSLGVRPALSATPAHTESRWRDQTEEQNRKLHADMQAQALHRKHLEEKRQAILQDKSLTLEEKQKELDWLDHIREHLGEPGHERSGD